MGSTVSISGRRSTPRGRWRAVEVSSYQRYGKFWREDGSRQKTSSSENSEALVAATGNSRSRGCGDLVDEKAMRYVNDDTNERRVTFSPTYTWDTYVRGSVDVNTISMVAYIAVDMNTISMVAYIAGCRYTNTH